MREFNEQKVAGIPGMIKLGGIIISAFLVLFLLFQIGDTVESGTFHVNQAAFSGEMSAEMESGFYPRLFADKWVFQKKVSVESQYPGRFNDSFTGNVKVAYRLVLPDSELKAYELISEHRLTTENAIIREVVEKFMAGIIRQTTNLMTARESYDEGRNLFQHYVREQALRGKYVTRGEDRRVFDPAVGDTVTKQFQVIAESGGQPNFQENPLDVIGVRLENIEVQAIDYDDKVNEQISLQQNAYGKISLAVAKEEQALREQALALAQGRLDSTNISITKMKERLTATEDAQRKAEQEAIAAAGAARRDSLAAAGQLAVAELGKSVARVRADSMKIASTEEAAAKKRIMAADGALTQKIDLLKHIATVNANAAAKYQGPSVVMGGGGNGITGPVTSAGAVEQYLQMLIAQQAKQLKFDLSTGGSVAKK